MSAPPHGEEPHRHLVGFIWQSMVMKGWKVMDPKDNAIFRQLRESCSPDIAARRDHKTRDERGRVTSREERVIVEVEINPTKASIAKKEKQYLENLIGWRLIIMDARKINGWRKGWQQLKMQDVRIWVEEHLI